MARTTYIDYHQRMTKAIEPLLFIASLLLCPLAVGAYFFWMGCRWVKSARWPSASSTRSPCDEFRDQTHG